VIGGGGKVRGNLGDWGSRLIKPIGCWGKEDRSETFVLKRDTKGEEKKKDEETKGTVISPEESTKREEGKYESKS